jgi:hypothetical protein
MEVVFMRKNLKRVAAVASAMALTVVSVVPAFAADAINKTPTYTGTIAADDLSMNVTLPATGSLTIKPYSATQITTAPLYFENTESTSDDDVVTYKVAIAGYSCVATSKTADNAIKVATTLPTSGTAKTFTATIETGAACASDAKKTTAADFKTAFGTASSTVAVEKLSEKAYDGTAATTYTKVTTPTEVKVEEGKAVPFRITGTMYTGAEWEEGDSITVVPVFTIGLEVGTKTTG